jgi:hypothetical protein
LNVPVACHARVGHFDFYIQSVKPWVVSNVGAGSSCFGFALCQRRLPVRGASRVRAGLRRAEGEGKQRIAPELEKRILAALNDRKRTGEGVRGIAKRFGVDPSTVQRISRPFADVAA